MATKEIGLKLKITSDGTEKVIKNLTDLEIELSRLQKEIKTLDFGSPAFLTASKNIQTLKSKIDDVDKATEGLGAEKRFRALGDSVNVLVGTFQVLSGIIGLVISDSESLEEVQKAESFALGVLNVALGINAVNTALVESATTRAALATKISTIATKAATIAQRIFNAVMSANPILLVVGAITLLTTALVVYTKSVSKATTEAEKENEILEEQKKLVVELDKARIEATSSAQIQFRILTDNVKARNLELSVIEELKKEYPGFNAFLNRNNELTAEGSKFLELQIKLLGLRANLDFLYKKQAELNVNSLTAVNEALAKQETFLGRVINSLKFGNNLGNQFFGAVEEAASEFAPQQAAVTTEIVKYESAVNDALGALKPFEKTLKDTAEAEKEVAKETKETTKVFDKQTQRVLERVGVLDLLVKKLGEAQGAELKFLDGVSEKQNEIIAQQNDFIQSQSEELATRGEVVSKTIRDLFFESIPSPSDFAKSTGVIFTLFDSIKERLNDSNFDLTKAIGFDTFLEEFTKGDDALKEFVKTIPEETKISFNEFFNSYRDRIDGLKKDFSEVGGVTIEFLKAEPDKLFELLRDVEVKQSELFKTRLSEGKTENQILEQGRELILEQILGKEGLTNAINKQKVAQENFNAALRGGDVSAIESAQLTLKNQQDIVNKYKELGDVILDGVVRNNKFVESIEAGKIAFEQAAVVIDKNATKILQPLDPAKVKEYFSKQAADYVFILRDITKNNEKYLQRFGLDGVNAILGGINLGLQDLEGKSREELQTLKTNLETFGGEIQKSFNLEENPFLKTLDEISLRLKKLPTEAQENVAKSLESITEVLDTILNVFNDLSSRFSTLLASNTSLLLEQLAYAEEQALFTIGSFTERERQEQEKVRKETAKKRFELEKQARVQELQFSIANTIASAAGAIVNALALPAPPPIPQLYAGTIAALTAAQVAVIRDQLQFTQSKQFIGRRGGLIQGQSHEGSNGGVPAMLEGGEFVVNKEGVRQFGDIISSINNATGGRSLSIDDSRIVQAIASQNSNTKQPLKAYVLYNDIQSTTKLNSKITQLARL